MNESDYVKIAVFVPESHADAVREAIGLAGAGKIGNYSYCTSSSKSVGRFKPENGAHPNVGEIGKIEIVAEEKIETVCKRDKLDDVYKAIKKVHPYEEIALDVWSLEKISISADK